MIRLALSEKREHLEALAQTLLQKETILGDELQEVIRNKVAVSLTSTMVPLSF
jgi:ATP-dependent Zn protease